MTEVYAYTPNVWPPLIVAIFMAILGLFSWQHRRVPGAQPFAIACLFAALWLAGVVAEVAAAAASTKFAWIRFQAVWSVPALSAMTCFALEYASLGHWSTRRNLLLLSVPPLLALFLILTNDLHHLMWFDSVPDGLFPPLWSIGAWFLTSYGLGLALVNVSVFI